MRAIAMVRARDDEAGAAMIVTVILSSVIATLSVLMLTVGGHADRTTARGRHFVQTLHVAESGVESAIAKIEEADGALASTTFSGSTELGTYEVTVTQLARNRYTIESTGAVRAGRVLGTERTLRVTMAPPLSFDKALFSYTTVETKNNDVIEGDVWGNHNVILAQGTRVAGSAVAATGYIRLNNGSSLDVDAWSGGFNPANNYAVFADQNATIGGNVTASVTTVGCTGSDNANYKVRLNSGGVVQGNVTTWGPIIEGSGSVNGTSYLNTCTQAPPTKELPAFTFAAANYSSVQYFGTPSTSSATAVTDFHTYVAGQGNRISGTFYINQSAPVSQSTRINLTNVTVDGDTTIITNTPIFTNGFTDDADDAIVMLASTYDPPAATTCDVNQDASECAMHLKNNFQTSGETAVLVYAPYGPVAIKNNQEMFGAVYADSIQVKNNQELTYDERVDRIVGFGETTLEIAEWQELVG